MGLSQHVRFCPSADGTRIAYARTGAGTPIVRAAHWLTHIELDRESAVWRPWIEALSGVGELVRYDERGCGLSDREVQDLSLRAQVADLEAVIEAAGLQRFVLLALSQGGAIAATYAARHPERVSHLVLLGAYVRGWAARAAAQPALQAAQTAEAAKLMIELVRVGWGQPNEAFHQMFTTQFMPDATPAAMRSFNEMQRVSTSREMACRILTAFGEFDASDLLPRIAVPTLVLHGRGDARVPLDEGRYVAASIPGARFIVLETRNHVLQPDEPAWAMFFDELRRFIATQQRGDSDAAAGAADLPQALAAGFAALTSKERDVLELLARGLDNAQIAANAGMAEKTVRNHVSRIFDKLGVENRSQAIVCARTAGFGRGARP